MNTLILCYSPQQSETDCAMHWFSLFVNLLIAVPAITADELVLSGDRAGELSRTDLNDIKSLCMDTQPAERLWAVVTDRSFGAPNKALRVTVYFHPKSVQGRLRIGSLSWAFCGIPFDNSAGLYSKRGRWVACNIHFDDSEVMHFAQVSAKDDKFLNAPGVIHDPLEGPFLISKYIPQADIIAIIDSVRAFLNSDTSGHASERSKRPVSVINGDKLHAEVWSSFGDKHFDTYTLDKRGEVWSVSKTGDFEGH